MADDKQYEGKPFLYQSKGLDARATPDRVPEGFYALHGKQACKPSFRRSARACTGNGLFVLGQQFRKVESSKFAKVFDGCHVSYLCCVNRIGIRSEWNLHTICHKLRSVFNAGYAYITRRVSRHTRPVSAVLLAGRWSQIFLFVVQSVAVFMIYPSTFRQTENKGSEGYTLLPSKSIARTRACYREAAFSRRLISLPVKFCNAIKVFGVDLGDLALSKWNQFYVWIYWLFYGYARWATPSGFLFSWNAASAASLGVSPFSCAAERTLVVLPREFLFVGRLSLRFSPLLQQVAHRVPPVGAGWAALEVF